MDIKEMTLVQINLYIHMIEEDLYRENKSIKKAKNEYIKKNL